MNRNSTIALLRSRFEKVEDCGPDLVRAERRHDGKAMSVLYFDFSEVLASSDFDLQNYLQKSFASDFYKNEGSLQWNYYLYFVLDKRSFSKLESPLRRRVESDRTFARKFIKEQGELNDDLENPLADSLKVEKPTQDIASRWTEELKKVGLGSVSDPAAEYANSVRDYLAEGTETVRRVTALPDGAPDGEFIRHIRWTHFRDHPKPGEFEFGAVNLIRGVNGAGKTSLLEAIELSICGGIRRQGGKVPSGAKLEVTYKGDEVPERSPNTSAQIYRARDRAWYGGYYRTGNNLCNNFGRFNFFDSDAAFQLSSSSEAEGIQKAINTLLLGELANTIEERMRNFSERFSREEKSMEKLLRARRDSVKATSEQLEKLKEVKDTRPTLIGELKSKAETCGWKKVPANPALDDLVVLLEAVEGAATELSENRESLRWMAKVSIANINRELEMHGVALAEVESLQEAASKSRIAVDKDKTRLAAKERELTVLARLRAYHEEEKAMGLRGFAETIESASTLLSKLDEAVRMLRSVDLAPFAAIRVTPDAFTEKQNEDLREARKSFRETQAHLQPLQARLGQINSLIQQIRGMGRHYCELSPDSKDCPLCGANYDELAARLEALDLNATGDELFRELTEKAVQQEERVKELEREVEVFAKVLRAAELVLGQEKAAITRVESTVKTLETLSERVVAARTDLAELRALSTSMKLAGFEEEELEVLIESAHGEFSLPMTKITNKDSLLGLFTERTKLVEELRKSVRDLEKAQGEFEIKIEKVRSRCFRDAEIDDHENELERRQEALVDVVDQLKDIKKQVSVGDDDNFSAVEKRLAVYAKSIERIQQAFRAIEEKDAIEQQLTTTLNQAQMEVAKLTPRYAKAKKAVEALERLAGDDYKNTYIEKLRSEHAGKVSNLFCRIHAPHEFKSVVLDESVTLERLTGVHSQISEISTGQRAALALSIFLSLNSSVTKHAPWLLFDDPVVHVDDLNVLSFFDTLRDLVLLDNRQVFFATASGKLADLFAKKFDCLGTEFRDITIKR